MKKTLTVNLNGKVFNIDEDAYCLLDNYLNNLKSYFGEKSDAGEILSDFESRIEELFSEKIKPGYEVITIAQVETVIKCMGSPEELGEEPGGSKKKGSTSANPEERKPKKKFYRNTDDKKIGGVCSGIAAYFGWDPLPVRLAFVLLTVLSTGSLAFLYLMLWILMPEAVTASQKLEMKGEPVTLENIGKTVSKTISSVKTTEIEHVFSTVFKIGTIIFGCLIGLPLMIAFFTLVVALIAMILGAGSLLLIPFDLTGIEPFVMDGHYPVTILISLIIIVAIPLFSIVYSLFYRGKKSSSNNLKWASFLVWIFAVITLCFASVQFVRQQNIDQIHLNIPWEIRCDSTTLTIEKKNEQKLN